MSEFYKSYIFRILKIPSWLDVYLIFVLTFLLVIMNDFGLTFPQDRTVEWRFEVPELGIFSPLHHPSWPCWFRNAKYHRRWGTRFLLNTVRTRIESSCHLRGSLSTKHWTYVPVKSYWILFVSADESEEAQRVRLDVSFTTYSELILPCSWVFSTEEHRDKIINTMLHDYS